MQPVNCGRMSLAGLTLLALFLTLASALPLAAAVNTPALKTANTPSEQTFTQYAGPAWNGTIGWSFTVRSVSTTVSSLGLYDSGGDGLANPHGDWTSSGTPVTSTTIPSGTGTIFGAPGEDRGGPEAGAAYFFEPPAPNLTINNITQNELNSGTSLFTFTVSLSSPAEAGGVTFDISTADGTAQDDNPTTEDNDYVQKSLTVQTIPAGSSTYTFDVTVNGDNTFEPNETFFVNVTNVVGATVSDGQGQGTITNDDVPPFTDINAALQNVQNSSAAWGDYDNDGDLDIAFIGIGPGISYHAKVYRNDGGTFTDINAGLMGVQFGSIAWGDYDNDGFIDLLITGLNSTAPYRHAKVYHNNGNGTFTDINAGLPGVSEGSAVWGDYDNDGDLDILLTGTPDGTTGLSKVYRNNSNGTFTDINAGLTGVSQGSAAWGDYDNDGDLDILLTGFDGANFLSKLYRNNGPSASSGDTFTDINAGLAGVFYSSVAWGDYDNDGDVDILLTGYQSGTPFMQVYRNDAGTFVPITTTMPGMYQGSVAWGDYDNDGDLDIALVGRTRQGSFDYPFAEVYRNDGTAGATAWNFTGISSGVDRARDCSVAWGDYDNDGKLDLLLTGKSFDGPPITRVYNNNAPNANTIPTAPSGLTATALSGNRIAFAWSAASDNQTPANGLSYNLRIGTTLNGLNTLSPMADVTNGYRRIAARGPQQILRDTVTLPTGQYYWSVQAVDAALAGGPFSATESIDTRPFVDISAVLTGVYDGSAAWGDYDNDGDLDILLTGIINSGGNVGSSLVYRNDGSGVFTDIIAGLPGVVNSSVAWGDYDNDGDLDILLTGSTNGSNAGAISKVYRNDGGGTFTDIAAGLTGVLVGSVAWGDYDNDGDLDILLTGLDAGNTRTSKIYRNNLSAGSGGTFTDINAGLPGTYRSSVAWGDYDNDGDLDILLSGRDFGGNYLANIYRNTAGTFSDINAGLTGVQQGSVAWGDYDNDGDLDILLTGVSISGRISKVYRNDPSAGSGATFTDINAALTAVNVSSVAWGDYNNDGDLDILLAGYDGATQISKVYSNDAGTFTDINAGLTGVGPASLAWGDYDNDGDLDILLSGLATGSVRVSAVYRNNTSTPNTVPNAPTGLTATQLSGNRVALAWSVAGDNQTPANGLSYNLRVGTTSGGINKLSPMANTSNGYRRVAARGPQQILRDTLTLPYGQYYWSLQAIDAALAGGPFATEGNFVLTPPCVPVTASLISLADGGSTSTICNGSSANLKVVVTGGTSPFTVVYNASPGGNVTVNSYTSGSNIAVTPSATTTYSIVSVTGSDGCVGSGNSGSVTVSVNDVTGGTVAADQAICSGDDPAAFTQTVASTGTGALTYQWQSSTTDCTGGFSDIAGATGTTYDPPAGLTLTTYYRRVTTSTLNAVACSANSNCIIVTVNNVTGGTVAADQIVCNGGDPAAFTETVASTGTGALTYQWQSSTTDCTGGFSDIAGATGTTYDPPAGLTLTTYYRRVTTSTLNAVTCTANSNCMTVTVNNVTGGTVAADQIVCNGGDPAAFTETVASTGTGALTYQWQSSITNCSTGFNPIAGATGATYDPPSGLTQTTYYRRVTTSTLNAVACSANSNCITVTVNNVTGGIVAADQTICSGGDPALFTETGASTGSGTLSYQWQSSTTNCSTGFNPIAGATGATYDPPSGLTQTTYYRRVTTSTQNGVACTANSNCITVTVNDVTGGTVAAYQKICYGDDPALFTETVASTGSGTLTYQWQSNTTGCAAAFTNIAGATSATYDAPSGLTQTTYYRRVTTSILNAVACTANSNCITVTVNSPFSATIQDVYAVSPGGQPNTIYIGYGRTSLTLMAIPSGGTPGYSYSWRLGLSPVVIGTSQTLVVSPSVVGTYIYTITITDNKGCKSTVSKTIRVMSIRCGNKNEKVTVCQVPPGNISKEHTVCVSPSAVATHLAKGSYLGPCASGNRTATPLLVIENEQKSRVLPNPNNGQFALQLPAYTSKAEIIITNANGSTIERRIVKPGAIGQTEKFDFRKNSAGMYFIKIISEDGIENLKVLLQR